MFEDRYEMSLAIAMLTISLCSTEYLEKISKELNLNTYCNNKATISDILSLLSMCGTCLSSYGYFPNYY